MSTSIRQKIALFTLLPVVLLYSLITAVFIDFSFKAGTAEVSRRHLEQSWHYASVIDGHLREILTGSQALALEMSFTDEPDFEHLYLLAAGLYRTVESVIGVGVLCREVSCESAYWKNSSDESAEKKSDKSALPNIPEEILNQVLSETDNRTIWYTSPDVSSSESGFITTLLVASGNSNQALRVDIDASRLFTPLTWNSERTRLIILNHEGVSVYSNGITLRNNKSLSDFVESGPCEAFSQINSTSEFTGQQLGEYLFNPLRKSADKPCSVFQEAHQRVIEQGESVNFRVSIRGDIKWVTALQLPLTGWYLSISMLNEELMGSVLDRALLSLLVTLLGLIGISVCLWWVSGRITKPLNQLKERITSYITIPDDVESMTSEGDEAVSLSNCFDTLIASLRDRENQLQKVRANNVGHLVDQIEGRYFYFHLDASGQTLNISHSVQAVLGYSEEEIGQSLKDCLTDSELNKNFSQRLALIASGESPETFEVEMRHKNGETKRIELFCTSTSELIDQGIFIEGLGNDISERKRIESELLNAKQSAEQASQAKSMFLSNISHELRTPMNGVLGYAQLLLMDKKLPESSRKNLQALEECGLHLMTLINDILDITKIESSGVTLSPQPFFLKPALNMVVASVRHSIKEKDVVLKLELDENIPAEIIADNIKLRQVLINLTGNAVKFTREGEVNITVMLKQDRILFSVKDSGIGIPEDRQSDLFKPFTQLHSDPSVGGTGLGLAISYRLVKAMGEELRVVSEEGKGSEFSFLMPFEWVPKSLNVTVDGQAEVRSLRKEIEDRPCILVVDDSKDNRQMLAQALKNESYNVDCCDSGEQAIEQCLEESYDVVLMDLKMPVINGYQAAETILKNSTQDSPQIIAVTADVSTEVSERVQKAGMVGLVAKPVIFSELFGKINELLVVDIGDIHDDHKKWVMDEVCRNRMTEFLETGDLEALEKLALNWQQQEVYGGLPNKIIELCRSFEIEKLEKLVAGDSLRGQEISLQTYYQGR